MAISTLPSCASRRFLHHPCGITFIPALSSPGPSASSSSLLAFHPLPSPAGFLALRAVTGAQGGEVGSSLGGSQDPALLRRPLVSPPTDGEEEEGEEGDQEVSASGVPETADGDEGGADERTADGVRGGYRSRQKEEDWVDWEDQILEDTVPLVSFVRMLLHSGNGASFTEQNYMATLDEDDESEEEKEWREAMSPGYEDLVRYESGDRLSPEHEKAIMEQLLPYHPECEKKIGCGIDYITVGYHPDFENSRCLFIVRKDGELVDFSYWKCIKGLIRKKYPLYADSFILRHFRRRRNNNE